MAYKKFGTQLRLEKEDTQFKPTKEHRPVRVLTLNNNTKYYEMTATIMKDDKERQQIGPKSPWEQLLQKQPATTTKTTSMGTNIGSVNYV